ncbi:MAG: cysteine synthase family protein [Marinilabiliaceae bacterium]|nr:cysteine synthase family protein [Marinilabiliaceae bacterium]
MKNQINDTKIAATFRELWKVVGNSSLFEIKFHYKGVLRTIYVKCEGSNFSGSIKDRMALYILQCAYERGEIKPGDTIVEATSGNTGIAFSALGAVLRHKVKILMPDWMSQERVDVIKSYGAEIIPVSKEEGGFLGSIRITEEIKANEKNIFLPRQFSNEDNAKIHQLTTANELWLQMQEFGATPDAFVAGVGTGGTVMGVGRYLREKVPNIKIFPMEPAESPTISTGYKVGVHRIQGISDEFIPALVKLDELDDVIQVADGDAILMAQKLAKQLGIAVGISSGANFVAAVIAQQKLGKTDGNVATIFPDCNKKYLSTDLMREEPIKEGYYSSDIELLEFKVKKVPFSNSHLL